MGNAEKRQPHKVEAQRTIFMFAHMMGAGRHALDDGTVRREGSFYEWMTASVFAAFSLEAYLNHLGPRRLKCWEELERLPVQVKLSLILEDLGQQPDFSCRPFKTVKEMLIFRNQMAHGRTKVVEETTIQELSPGERPRYPEMQWESQCTHEAAQQFLDDASAVITQLHEWAGLDTFLLFSP